MGKKISGKIYNAKNKNDWKNKPRVDPEKVFKDIVENKVEVI